MSIHARAKPPWGLHHNWNQKSFLKFLLLWLDIHGKVGDLSAGEKIFKRTII